MNKTEMDTKKRGNGTPHRTSAGRTILYAKSDRRGSNPRPPPWQGGVLPTVLLSHNSRSLRARLIMMDSHTFVNPLKKVFPMRRGRLTIRKL